MIIEIVETLEITLRTTRGFLASYTSIITMTQRSWLQVLSCLWIGKAPNQYLNAKKRRYNMFTFRLILRRDSDHVTVWYPSECGARGRPARCLSPAADARARAARPNCIPSPSDAFLAPTQQWAHYRAFENITQKSMLAITKRKPRSLYRIVKSSFYCNIIATEHRTRSAASRPRYENEIMKDIDVSRSQSA